MSTGEQCSGDAANNAILSPVLSNRDIVPQQFKEILELMSSVNRRLEDCAVEWQSTISGKQWRILDDQQEPASEKPWEQSLLARTYFVEKSLDDAFQSLLAQDRTFTDQLNNFVALLRGDESSTFPTTACDAQNQCPDPQSMDYSEESNRPVIDPLDLSLLENGNTRKTRKSKRLAAENTRPTIQESFADLIKAKINLDTKFLGFEAILNGTTEIIPPMENSSCLCQICSNVLGNAVDKSTLSKSISAVRQKVQRLTKARPKRLKKSARTRTRRQTKIQPMSLANIGDQAPTLSPTPYKESIVE